MQQHTWFSVVQDVIDSVKKCIEAERTQVNEGVNTPLHGRLNTTRSELENVAGDERGHPPSSDQPADTVGETMPQDSGFKLQVLYSFWRIMLGMVVISRVYAGASSSDAKRFSLKRNANSPSADLRVQRNMPPGHHYVAATEKLKRQKLLLAGSDESGCSPGSCPSPQKVSEGVRSCEPSEKIRTDDTCGSAVLSHHLPESRESSSEVEWSCSEDSDSDCAVTDDDRMDADRLPRSTISSRKPRHSTEDGEGSNTFGRGSGKQDDLPLRAASRVRNGLCDGDDDTNQSVYSRRISEWMKQQRDGKQNGDETWLDGEVADLGSGLKVPLCVWQQLYPYQQEGVRWLCGLHIQEVGGLLGDEMGMGKTVQMAVFLASLHFSNVLKVRSNLLCS